MIESVTNTSVKAVVGLRDKAKRRREEGAFVAEGPRMVLETPLHLLERVFVTEAFLSDSHHREGMKPLQEAAIPIETVTEKVLKTMSDTVTPQGILAVIRQPKYALSDLLGDEMHPAMLVILEKIQDPGNLGTIFRTAEGAGCTGVLLSRDTVDLFSPKVVRATMGALYRMPFFVSEDLYETLQGLRLKGVKLFAAALDAQMDHADCDYTRPCGFLIGNEGNGLSHEAMELADQKVLIPMEGKLESLNASVAAAILMYEANRQRRRR
ncbi:MAG: RNA methyltransferase [Lachnospiraceae bacterium]|nr:RNA methyltransferase [Lachnospiraceae bacterium]